MTKRCTSCGVEKALGFFSGAASICKECDKIRAREYYLKNKGRVKARTASYRQHNPDKHSEYNKKYYNNNKHVYRRKEIMYQVSKRRQTPVWLSKPYLAEVDGFYEFCQIFPEFQVDHIVPLNGKEVSGMHVPWNLQVLPRRENVKKRNFFNPSMYPKQGMCVFMES